MHAPAGRARPGRARRESRLTSPTSRSSWAARWSSAARRTTRSSPWTPDRQARVGAFFTGGPVRFAPAAWRDRVFVASDDGCLYALVAGRRQAALEASRRSQRADVPGQRADDLPLAGAGRPGGPGRHRLLRRRDLAQRRRVPARAGRGNGQRALDATTEAGGLLHAAAARRGRTPTAAWRPQGYLLADGRAAVRAHRPGRARRFRRDDGQLEYYLLQENGSMGGSRAMVADRFVDQRRLLPGTERPASWPPEPDAACSALCPTESLQFTGSNAAGLPLGRHRDARPQGQASSRIADCRSIAESILPTKPDADCARPEGALEKSAGAEATCFAPRSCFKDADANVARANRAGTNAVPDHDPTWSGLGGRRGPLPGHRLRTHARSHRRRPRSRLRRARAWSLSSTSPTKRVAWSHDVEGRRPGAGRRRRSLCSCPRPAASSTASRNRSSADRRAHRRPQRARRRRRPRPSTTRLAAEEILRKSGVTKGICLDLGCGDGELALELVRRSHLHVIGIEATRPRSRRRDAAWPTRACTAAERRVHHGDLGQTAVYPALLRRPDRLVADSSAESVRGVEPGSDPQTAAALTAESCASGQPGELQTQRRGPLEGAGQWTHQNCDAGQYALLRRSRWSAVRSKIAWYRDGVLEIPDRHAQGPAPLFNRRRAWSSKACTASVRWTPTTAARAGSIRSEDILADWDGVHHDVGVGDTRQQFLPQRRRRVRADRPTAA